MNRLTFIFAALLATPALAEQACAPRDAVATHLGARFHEAQTGAGLASPTRIVEVWASEDGSWTILVTNADGLSCILAAGTHWRAVEPVVGEEG